MAWTESKVFTQFLVNPGLAALSSVTEPTTYGAGGIVADTVKAALFDSSITPNKDAVVGQTGYNSGSSQWLTFDEVTHANWAAGGRAVANDAMSTGSGYVMYDADDLAGGGTLTLADVNGCLVYDDTITGGTVADQGICYNWFGGAQSVTSGTFTIVWHANGIFRITT